jgi:hypothetical protein
MNGKYARNILLERLKCIKKIIVLWDAMSYSLVEVYRSSGGKKCLYLQGRKRNHTDQSSQTKVRRVRSAFNKKEQCKPDTCITTPKHIGKYNIKKDINETRCESSDSIHLA